MNMGEVSGGDPLTRSTERINNALGSLEEQIDQVVAQMGKEDDPKKLKELEGRLMKLERLQSTMSKMLERLQTMMQNLAAMYHKLQMSAIQNIR
jgi:DNA repair ATPase RecN